MEDPSHRRSMPQMDTSGQTTTELPLDTPIEYGERGPRLPSRQVRATDELDEAMPREDVDGIGGLPNLNPVDAKLDPLLDNRIRYEKSTRMIPHAVRNLASSLRSRSQEPPKLSDYNPDPMPYQPKLFKSSTHLKMVPLSRRHQEMYMEKTHPFGHTGQQSPAKKPIIIHAERHHQHQWEDIKPLYGSLPLSAKLIGQRISSLTRSYSEIRPSRSTAGARSPSMTQRERMLAEQDYLEKMRSAKRDNLPVHRETRELMMGSRKMEFNERYDVKDELRRLKSIVLPTHARELFHGKGIKLPVNHASLKPRLKMPPTITPRVGAGFQSPLPTIHRLFDVDDIDEDNDVVPEDDAMLKTKTAPNPLQGEVDLIQYDLVESQLRGTFTRLDKDSQGHLKYNQVKESLPPKLNNYQEKYVKQVYDVAAESTSFGIQEFMNLHCLCCEIELLGEEIITAYEKLDFTGLREKLVQYLDLFQSIDRLNSGKIKMESLDEILALQMQLDIEEDKPTFQTIQKPIKMNNQSEISRIKYVAHIPYFIQKEKSSPFTDDEDGPDDDEGEQENRTFMNTLQNIPVAM